MRGFIFTFFSLLFLHNLQAQIVVPAQGCVMENFDTSNPWTFGGANSSWLWDNPNKAEITDDQTGGGNCIILGGNGANTHYNDNEDSWAMTPEYDLSAVDNPYLDFFFYHSNEDHDQYDQIWMEYSIDGGNTWQNLEPNIGTNNCYDMNWYNQYSNWGGASAAAATSSSSGNCSFGGGIGPTDWIQVRKCINNLANESSVYFRFRIDAGFTCNFWGATIDNFKICDAFIDANADFTCTSNPLEVMFLDLTDGCTDSWSWNFGDGNTAATQNPTHTYANPGTYTVTLSSTATLATTAGCGGPYNDTYTFDIEVLEVSEDLVTDPSCSGISDGSVSVNVNGNTGGVTYNWSPAGVNGQGTASISNLSDGTYTVDVTPDNSGCGASLDVQLINGADIIAGSIVSDESCQGECDGSIVINNVNGGTQPYTYSWTNTTSATNTASALCAGNYEVTIEDDNGCSVTIPLEVEPGSSGNVSSDFSMPDSVFFYESMVTPTPDETGGSWSASCGNCIDNNSGAFDPNIAGIGAHQICYVQGAGNCQTNTCKIIIVVGCVDETYHDTLTIENGEEIEIHDTIRTEEGLYTGAFTSQYNCDSIVHLYLDVLFPFEVEIPNVFTPNGDQVNDYFHFNGKGFISYECEVYNRWGQKINFFDDTQGWDGKTKGGKEVPTANYYGKAKFILEDQSTKTLQFVFQLVRE